MNPYLRSVLEGGNAKYQTRMREEGLQTTTNYLDQGLGQTMGKGVAGGYVAGMATLPIVKNNLQYAEPWMQGMDALGKVADFQGKYGAYKSALGLLDPDTGAGSFGNAMGVGNMAEVGYNQALGLNPITSVLGVANSLTANRKNPYGTLPIVSDIAQFVGETARGMNESPIGRGISRFSEKVYNNTLAPVLDNGIGRGLYQTASIPFGGVEGVFGLLREGYESLDRNLFSNKLPGGSDIDLPETQEYNNPFRKTIDAITSLPDAFRSNEKIDLDNQYDILKESGNSLADINIVDKLVERGIDRYDAINSVLGHLERPNPEVDQLISEIAMTEGVDDYLYGTGITDGVIIDDATGFTYDAVTGEPTIKPAGDVDINSLLPQQGQVASDIRTNMASISADRTTQMMNNMTRQQIDTFRPPTIQLDNYISTYNPRQDTYSVQIPQIPNLCWVAREVYGQDNPKWLMFREWVINYSPRWFFRAYLKHGEKLAEFLKGKELLKKPIRAFMDMKVKEMETMKKEAIQDG